VAKKNKKQAIAQEGGIKVVVVNRKARRDYEILDTFEAGLALLGSEVKSIREGEANLRESYVRFLGDELYLVGCHITPYKFASIDPPDPVRDRKLLLHRRELDRLAGQVQQKGLTIVPLRLYFKKGRCKIEIGVGRGKKLHDKRESLKEKASKKEIDRQIKKYI